jgi:outer membrane murein-binding lipoprotein Lpp
MRSGISTSVQDEAAVCPLTGCAGDAKNFAMKDAVQRLNIEYGLNLSDDEIEQIANQAEAAQRLFQKLFEVDVEGVAPTLKIELTDKR